MYLEFGHARTRSWIRDVFKPLLSLAYDVVKPVMKETDFGYSDSVSRFKNWTDARGHQATFEFVEEGKPPRNVFTCTITFRGRKFEGKGSTKQRAKNA